MSAGDRLHRAVAEYLSAVLDKSVPWTTFPAGGGGAARGCRLKALGLHPGWPDVQIIGSTGRYIGIELKDGTGVLSRDQRRVSDHIVASGGTVTVCRSVDDVRDALRVSGISTRERDTILAAC